MSSVVAEDHGLLHLHDERPILEKTVVRSDAVIQGIVFFLDSGFSVYGPGNGATG